MSYFVPGLVAVGGVSLVAMVIMSQQSQTPTGEGQKEVERAQRAEKQVQIEKRKRQEASRKHKEQINVEKGKRQKAEAELASLRHAQVIRLLEHIATTLQSMDQSNHQLSPRCTDAGEPITGDAESC